MIAISSSRALFHKHLQRSKGKKLKTVEKQYNIANLTAERTDLNKRRRKIWQTLKHYSEMLTKKE